LRRTRHWYEPANSLPGEQEYRACGQTEQMLHDRNCAKVTEALENQKEERRVKVVSKVMHETCADQLANRGR
jgi:hypothetical protein